MNIDAHRSSRAQVASRARTGVVRVLFHAIAAACIFGGPFFASLVLTRPNDYLSYSLYLGAYLAPSALGFGWVVLRIGEGRFQVWRILLAYACFGLFWVLMVTKGIVWIQEQVFGVRVVAAI